jgi:hypothetical protein
LRFWDFSGSDRQGGTCSGPATFGRRCEWRLDLVDGDPADFDAVEDGLNQLPGFEDAGLPLAAPPVQDLKLDLAAFSLTIQYTGMPAAPHTRAISRSAETLDSAISTTISRSAGPGWRFA